MLIDLSGYQNALPYLTIGGGLIGGLGGAGVGLIDYMLSTPREADFYNQVIAPGLGYGLSGALGGAVGVPVGAAIGGGTSLPSAFMGGGYGMVTGGLGPAFTYLFSRGNYYRPENLLEDMMLGSILVGTYGAARGAFNDLV